MRDLREIDAQRTSAAAPSRAQKLRLRGVSRAEAALGGRARELADAIRGERADVTAQLMMDVETDLMRIATLLSDEGDYRTGERTQALQRDVEESLLWLLEALRQEQARRQSGEDQQRGAQRGQNQEPPLIPDATELKLLRRMEIDVQESVEELLRIYPELSGEDVDPLILEDISRLAAHHERITELFQAMRERIGVPEPGPANE
jgi:hypothetical protein